MGLQPLRKNRGFSYRIEKLPHATSNETFRHADSVGQLLRAQRKNISDKFIPIPTYTGNQKSNAMRTISPSPRTGERGFRNQFSILMSLRSKAAVRSHRRL